MERRIADTMGYLLVLMSPRRAGPAPPWRFSI
jgi:hypothetical protein